MQGQQKASQEHVLLLHPSGSSSGDMHGQYEASQGLVQPSQSSGMGGLEDQELEEDCHVVTSGPKELV